MDRHASYARRSSRGLASAAILMTMAAICVTAHASAPARPCGGGRLGGVGGIRLVVPQKRGRRLGPVHVVAVSAAKKGETEMTTYQDVPCLEHGLPDDIAGTMEAIAAVVHEVDSSMTVGEIVCLAYLRGAATRCPNSNAS